MIRSERDTPSCTPYAAFMHKTGHFESSSEIEKMLLKLPEALSATNKSRQKSGRGYNLEKVICDIGMDLSSSYNEIHSCVPPEYAEDLFAFEDTDSFMLLKYINGYMSGDALVEGVLDSTKYAECQTQLMKMGLSLFRVGNPA